MAYDEMEEDFRHWCGLHIRSFHTCQREDFRAGFRAARDRIKNSLLVDEDGNEYVMVCMLKEKITELQAELTSVKAKLQILRRYHGGDGTITREQTIEALSLDAGEKIERGGE